MVNYPPVMLATLCLLFALTRAEIIERFKAPPLVKAGGLVQVFADCPADMRREYQQPVAAFAADVCRTLARHVGAPATHREPAILVHIGDVRTNLTAVSSVIDGLRTRLYLPAPGYADTARFRLELVKAFFRAVKGLELDDAAAEKALVAADPNLRVEAEYARLAQWLAGDGSGAERDGSGGAHDAEAADEEGLKLARAVLAPGVARAADVLRFAARLRLYPHVLDAPFARRYPDCTFAEAVEFADRDPRLRFAAYEKAPLVVALGGGRGEALTAAATAYSDFLFDLARYRKPKAELRAQLAGADALLRTALEEARKHEEENDHRQYR